MSDAMNMTATRNDPAMLLRLPAELKQKIDAAARESGRSRNTEVLSRLAKSFGLDRTAQSVSRSG